MNYKRFYREGPGEMPPADYATRPEDMRTLTDEETENIVRAKNAELEAQDALLKAAQERAAADGVLDATLESKGEAAARIEAIAEALAAPETGTLEVMDELEQMKSIRAANERAEVEAARVEAFAAENAGDLRLMKDHEVDYSIAAERRLRGEPDEVIEVETPEWLKDDPEFAMKEDPKAMRLVETNLDMLKSMDSQRSVEAKRERSTEFVEVTAPEGIMDDGPETIPLELASKKPKLTIDAAEQERIRQVLGPSNAPKRAPQVKAAPQGLLSRIRGWFGGK